MCGAKSIRLLARLVIGFSVVASGLAQERDLSSSNQTNDRAQTTPISGLVDDERYRIGRGDVLEIRVFARPQLSKEATRVDGSGRIRMPLIQDGLVAMCRTEMALAEEIADRYRTYLKNPQVDVYVKEFNSEPVAVMGAVNRPGSFQLQRRVRLRELLTLAGGPSADAGRTVQVIHDESVRACEAVSAGITTSKVNFTLQEADLAENTETDPVSDANLTSVDLRAMLGGNIDSNPYVRPGDFIHIPQADQVFVVGNVYKPSALPLTEPLTVSRAIARAGGVLANTKRSRIRIVHSGSDSNAVTYVDLERTERHEQADILLEANDIVEVPTSIGKVALRGFFGGIVPAYAIYAPLTIIR